MLVHMLIQCVDSESIVLFFIMYFSIRFPLLTLVGFTSCRSSKPALLDPYILIFVLFLSCACRHVDQFYCLKRIANRAYAE